MVENTKRNFAFKFGEILMPHLSHQWRVVLSGVPQETKDQIAMQAVRVSLNYKEKTISLEIEQPIQGGALHQILSGWINGGYPISIIALGGNARAEYVITLMGLTCLDHTFDLDYSSSSIATHRMVFSYQSLSMGDPDKVNGEVN